MIEEFKQGNGKFARDLHPFFELGDGETATFMRGQRAADVIDHIGVKDEVFGDADKLAAFDQLFEHGARHLRRRGRLNEFGSSLLSQLLLWAAINVFIGFSTPGIDNAAHLGGCAAGFLLGLAQRGPSARSV